MPDKKGWPRCSYIEVGTGNPCGKDAVYAAGLVVGNWLCGLWVCEEHKATAETSMPLLPDGMPAVHIAAGVRRSPIWAPLDYLHDLEEGHLYPVPQMQLTCDRCGLPIRREFDRWVHVDAQVSVMAPPHEAIPG